MRNERASQPGAAWPKSRCLADSTIDEASLSAQEETHGLKTIKDEKVQMIDLDLPI
jgi:hypothetical protein